ncbi:MAG: oxidoreductase [Acidobacteria bacterium]|nr:oxidoreductase [Acidobacteriota bacterium]
MKTSRTALLVGATGLVGGHCLELLLQDEAYERVVTLGRRQLPLRHAKLTQQVIDFARLPEYAELMRAQDVFCALGTTIRQAGSQEAFYQVDFTYTHEVARLAQANGAEQFLLVSSLGADARSRLFYNRVKGETEEAVGRLAFDGVQIFRPSLLLGERAQFRLGERMAEKLSRLFSFLFLGSLQKYRPVHARTVAAAMVTVAKRQPRGVNIFESDEIRAMPSDSRRR